MEKNNKKVVKPTRSLLRYTDIAFRMGATIAFGTWFGKWLDEKMGMSKPLYLPIFAILAVGLAMYLVIKDANKLNK
ncbi:MAG: AtpZ/AtpI family protein [Saprospiraceae bacterium]|nr:AtpZ/AtpI family protein [Saprospiraceae bacterium]